MFIKGIQYERLLRNRGLQPTLQIVFPQSWMQLVLEEIHDDIFAGHLGTEKTFERIRLRYYWPSYYLDVNNWCESCEECLTRNGKAYKSKAPLINIPVQGRPFEEIAIDFLEIKPPTSRRNRYIIVVQNYFTKWIDGYPMKDIKADKAARLLVMRFPTSAVQCPLTLIKDHSSNQNCSRSYVKHWKQRKEDFHVPPTVRWHGQTK